MGLSVFAEHRRSTELVNVTRPLTLAIVGLVASRRLYKLAIYSRNAHPPENLEE